MGNADRMHHTNTSVGNQKILHVGHTLIMTSKMPETSTTTSNLLFIGQPLYMKMSHERFLTPISQVMIRENVDVQTNTAHPSELQKRILYMKSLFAKRDISNSRVLRKSAFCILLSMLLNGKPNFHGCVAKGCSEF